MKKNNAAAFLANMQTVENDEPVAKPAAKAESSTRLKKANGSSREGLKHIGGYLDADTVEKVAILRARLKMDNSELITEAINDLFNRQQAKRAFSD